MEDFGAVMRGFGSMQLENAFGGEWNNLDSEGCKLVLQDYLEAAQEDVTAREYLRRIGRGNLASYARTMKVRAANGWNEPSPRTGNYR